MGEFTNNPLTLQPTGKSETRAKAMLVRVAGIMKYDVDQGSLDYSKRVNTDALYAELRRLEARLVKGLPENTFKDLSRIAGKLNATLAAQ